MNTFRNAMKINRSERRLKGGRHELETHRKKHSQKGCSRTAT